MNFAQRIIDSVDEEKIINEVVSKVMDNLDLDSLVEELHKKLVYALIDKISRELSHAVNPVKVDQD